MRRLIRNYIISKIVSLMMVGTCVGQAPKVVEFAHAIARAEGFYIHGSIPQRCANPGDLKGTKFLGQTGLCKGGHARFANADYGWQALYAQVEKMVSDTSAIYRSSMTFREIGRLYAGNSKPWIRIVTSMLEVTPDQSIYFYFDQNRHNLITNLEDSWDFNVAAEIIPSDVRIAAVVSVARIGM